MEAIVYKVESLFIFHSVIIALYVYKYQKNMFSAINNSNLTSYDNVDYFFLQT